MKGDLGFAELSMTASYFDRSIKYEWDNANYSQWRSAYYGGYGVDPDDPGGSYNVYNTGTLIGTTVQRPEAGSLGVRSAADLAGREPLRVDGRRLLRGRLRLRGTTAPSCRD